LFNALGGAGIVLARDSRRVTSVRARRKASVSLKDWAFYGRPTTYWHCPSIACCRNPVGDSRVDPRKIQRFESQLGPARRSAFECVEARNGPASHSRQNAANGARSLAHIGSFESMMTIVATRATLFELLYPTGGERRARVEVAILQSFGTSDREAGAPGRKSDTYTPGYLAKRAGGTSGPRCRKSRETATSRAR